MIRKRLVGEPLLPCRFSLGKWGLIINSITLAYVVLAYVLIFFPTIPAPALIDMNWTIVMYSTIVAFSLVYYYFQGRFTYKGPVTEVKQY
jgi:choline transport protein